MGRKILWLSLFLAVLLCFSATGLASDDASPDYTTLGEGATTFFVCVEPDAAESELLFFVINSDEASLKDALLKVGLIQGEEASWGFNVTTVNGVKADYDARGEYWSIYVYDVVTEEIGRLETGIGSTPIAPNDLFIFAIES